MRNKWIKAAAVLAAAAAGGTLFYTKVYLPKSTYAYVVPARGDMNMTVFGIGTVGAKRIIPVSANTGGKLVEVLKDQGDRVKKGDVIARLDPVDLPDQLAQAVALREKAHRETLAAEAELAGLGAQLELAKKTFRRYETLYRQHYAAQVEYDRALTDLRAIEAQIAASKSHIAAAEAEEERARRNIDALKVRIDRLTVTAPCDGIVIGRHAEVSQSIVAVEPIVTMVVPDEVWVRANIDERISGRIAVGQEASITLRSDAKRRVHGRVARIEAESDPVTEERIVDVAFENLPEPFYINEQAEVTIVTGRVRDTLTLPTKVLRRGGVWVYDNGEARFRKLEIVERSGDRVAVRGLGERAVVLVPDPHKKPLFDGADVRI